MGYTAREVCCRAVDVDVGNFWIAHQRRVRGGETLRIRLHSVKPPEAAFSVPLSFQHNFIPSCLLAWAYSWKGYPLRRLCRAYLWPGDVCVRAGKPRGGGARGRTTAHDHREDHEQWVRWGGPGYAVKTTVYVDRERAKELLVKACTEVKYCCEWVLPLLCLIRHWPCKTKCMYMYMLHVHYLPHFSYIARCKLLVEFADRFRVSKSLD